MGEGEMARCNPGAVKVFFGTTDNENVRLLRAFGRTEPVLFVYPRGNGARWCLAELTKMGAHRPAKRWPWGVFFIIDSTGVYATVEAVIQRTMGIRVQVRPNHERDIASELLETLSDEELEGE